MWPISKRITVDNGAQTELATSNHPADHAGSAAHRNSGTISEFLVEHPTGGGVAHHFEFHWPDCPTMPWVPRDVGAGDRDVAPSSQPVDPSTEIGFGRGEFADRLDAHVSMFRVLVPITNDPTSGEYSNALARFHLQTRSGSDL